MRTKHARRFAIAGILAATVMATAANADTFRWAGQTDPQTLDPHAANTAPVLGFSTTSMTGWSAAART